MLRMAGFGMAVLLAGWALAAVPAVARVTEKTTYYSISGKDGAELLRDMNRRGPKHGFLTKAIAQTQFKTEYLGDIVHHKGVCRTKGAGFVLAITYVYPQPARKLTGELALRWRAFQATNVAHEKHHGKIAHQMAAAVDATLKRFSMTDDQNCRKAIARLGRDVDRIIDGYNKAQRDFDVREHRPGGPVEKSVHALIGKKKPGPPPRKVKPAQMVGSFQPYR